MGKIIIGVLVLAGAGYLIWGGGKKDDKNPESAVQTEESQNQVSSEEANTSEEEFKFNEKTSISTLMKKGGNYVCNFTHSTEMGDSKGTVYIAKENIRGDFVTDVKVPGMGSMSVESHMISDGESTYTWSSASEDGFKGPIAKEDSSEKESSSPVSINQDLDYDCVSWNVDDSKFSLPTNITFKQI